MLQDRQSPILPFPKYTLIHLFLVLGLAFYSKYYLKGLMCQWDWGPPS